jgi:hypothetical protein
VSPRVALGDASLTLGYVVQPLRGCSNTAEPDEFSLAEPVAEY